MVADVSGFDASVFAQRLADGDIGAFDYVMSLAHAGDAAAQTIGGQMLLDGQGCVAQPAEGVYWFMQAAHQHSPMAMNMLGRCHENGWGTVVDYPLAAVWFRRAAEHGLDWGMYNYAHMLERGRGIGSDRGAAFLWFGRAAALGHARAMNFLARYYEHGWETDQDTIMARSLYERSALAGDYRGECSWASVLVAEERFDDAAIYLERGLSKAPAAFIEAMRETLGSSGNPRVRELLSTCLPASGT
ncbi:tetratricopeptide repeat protein [Rothia nasimurium]|uniref:Sel1 repeat family protein n=1 Tax=Luteibacter anthropi TaxID=564369 RepID=A0A7X5ZHB3_9GAMM|nr:sel1 repeat family protein [Luteibacter anthropi]